jgi:hypothetical protein
VPDFFTRQSHDLQQVEVVSGLFLTETVLLDGYVVAFEKRCERLRIGFGMRFFQRLSTEAAIPELFEHSSNSRGMNGILIRRPSSDRREASENLGEALTHGIPSRFEVNSGLRTGF